MITGRTMPRKVEDYAFSIASYSEGEKWRFNCLTYFTYSHRDKVIVLTCTCNHYC